jgi:2-C-methyl-D-erythritol 4-phosphate cytidylyltransferase
MPSTPRFWAVIPAAGSGMRMGGDMPKQYLRLAGRTVIEHVLECFLVHPRIAGITVAISAGDAYWQKYQPRRPAKPLLTTAGGEERAHSVLNGLHALRRELQADDWVLVHDAVRPCLHAEDLDKLMQTLERDQVGGILASPLADTVKYVNENHLIHGTSDRQKLWRAFTPQMFRYGLLSAALESALASGPTPTDEAAAVETAYPDRVHVVEGRSDNIKITRPSDLALAEAILASHKGSEA